LNLATERPNILHILSDQHAPHVLGCTGDESGVTPHLDALARRGVVLEHVYAPSPICVPSRMAMLTGRHPHEVSVWTNRDTLGSGHATFVHALGAAGYDTTLIGRLHSLGPDQLRGYRHRLIGDHEANFYGYHPAHRGVLEGTAGPDLVSLERSGSGLSPYQVHDEDVTAAALGLLRHLGARKRSGLLAKPFCVSLGYMLPHAPFVASRDDYLRFAGSIPPPSTREPFGEALHPFIRWWRTYTRIEEVPEETVTRARAGYWGLVARLDSMIGEVLTALREHGLEQDTLVIYTSDHGDHVGEHDLWWKHTFYEQSIGVPALLAWPGRIPARSRRGELVSSLDLTSTILAASGAPQLPGASGHDLLSLLVHGDDSLGDHAVLSEYCSDEFAPPEGTRQRMVRTGEWKLVYYEGYPAQLFNLNEDPAELEDRGGDPGSASVREELVAMALRDWSLPTIAAQMELNRRSAELIGAWAEATRPDDLYRWSLTPEMSRLDPA
jgi:choline-sulfatase